MQTGTRNFVGVSSAALEDEKIQRNLKGLYDGFHSARIAASEATPGWEQLRERGRAIKAHTIDNLDYYLEMVERTVTAAGGHVYFALDSDAAA